jgi:hypothetical protein
MVRALLALPALILPTIALAEGPGEGTLTQHSVPIGDCLAASVTVMYRLDSLMGEPTVGGSFRWEGAECEAPYDTVVWLRVSNSEAEGHVRLDPAVPAAGAGYGMNTTDSPNWEGERGVLCGYRGHLRASCLPEADAKRLWKTGTVTGFSMEWDHEREAERAREQAVRERAEEARQAEAARREEEAELAEAQRAQEAQQAEEAQRAQEAQQVEEAQRAQEAQQTEEAQRAQEAQQAELERIASEERQQAQVEESRRREEFERQQREEATRTAAALEAQARIEAQAAEELAELGTEVAINLMNSSDEDKTALAWAGFTTLGLGGAVVGGVQAAKGRAFARGVASNTLLVPHVISMPIMSASYFSGLAQGMTVKRGPNLRQMILGPGRLPPLKSFGLRSGVSGNWAWTSGTGIVHPGSQGPGFLGIGEEEEWDGVHDTLPPTGVLGGFGVETVLSLSFFRVSARPNYWNNDAYWLFQGSWGFGVQPFGNGLLSPWFEVRPTYLSTSTTEDEISYIASSEFPKNLNFAVGNTFHFFPFHAVRRAPALLDSREGSQRKMDYSPYLDVGFTFAGHDQLAPGLSLTLGMAMARKFEGASVNRPAREPRSGERTGLNKGQVIGLSMLGGGAAGITAGSLLIPAGVEQENDAKSVGGALLLVAGGMSTLFSPLVLGTATANKRKAEKAASAELSLQLGQMSELTVRF